MVRNWSPLAVISGRSEPAPNQARPIPAAMTSRNPSHSVSVRPLPAERWAAGAVATGLALGPGGAFALGALALELAGAANRGGALAGALLRRLLIMTAQLHLAVDALALQLLLQRAQR